MSTIKDLRKKAGLSQKEFADLFNVHQTAVSQWETGKTTPDKETLIKISDYFNISVDSLLGKTDIKNPRPKNEEELINNDPKLTEYLEELRNRPEMRMMFSLAKSATKEDVEKAVKIIEAFLSDK